MSDSWPVGHSRPIEEQNTCGPPAVAASLGRLLSHLQHVKTSSDIWFFNFEWCELCFGIWHRTSRVPLCVVGVTRTLPVAAEAVAGVRTQARVTDLPRVSGLTHTHPVGVVALAVVLTATRLCTTGTIGTNGTLVLAPVQPKRRGDIHGH